MNISAIIAEYNPLHNGHVYHINKTKEMTNTDGLICVMSGNFVQRGGLSILDKWTRTKMALENGIDLVIELPCIYSLSSAEFFSFGAISLLSNLGVVNNLSFGSEYGDTNILLKIANILTTEPKDYKIILKKYLDEGLNYPTARSKAIFDFMSLTMCLYDSLKKDLQTILSSSNNILGIEYCKSLLKLNSTIKPFTIKRNGSTYNCENFESEFSSATSIRKYLRENKNLSNLKKYIPKNCYDQIIDLVNNNYSFSFTDNILPFIKYKDLTFKNKLHLIPDVIEGLDNRISKYLKENLSLDEMIKIIKSKRYTYNRISRILCQYFIGFENFEVSTLRKQPCPYARILGFNKTGATILKNIKNNSTIPIYTKLPKHNNDILNLELLSTKAYSLINKSVKYNDDYLKSPIIIK